MSYAKVFDNFEWVDQEDGETTPLSAANLNLINTALNLIDDRVIEILNGPFEAYVISLNAIGVIRTDLLAAHTGDGTITVSDDTCFSEDVEVEGDLSLAGSLAFQNIGTNTISSPTALTVTTPVSLTLNATSGIELSTGSGKATYNGSELALKSDLTNSWEVINDTGVSVASGADYTLYHTPTKSGYTAVGVLGYRVGGAYGSYCITSSIFIDSGTINWTIHNTASSTATAKFYAAVLWQKD